MEIHELNTFSGTLGANDYFVTDNGTDTSKVPATGITDPLNARIDNIIAGGTAPSAAEVTDARLGAAVLGSVQYSSLGDAVRGQSTALYNDDLNIKETLKKYNAYPLSEDIITRTSGTHNGITYNWNGKVCTVSGTASSVSVNILVSQRNLSNFLVPGNKYPVKYKTTNINVGLNFAFYDANNVATYIHFTTDGILTVPANAVKWSVRLYVASGVSFSPSAVVSETAFLNNKSIQDLLSEVSNAYVGADGVTYGTLGDSIRGQVNWVDGKISSINSDISDINSDISGVNTQVESIRNELKAENIFDYLNGVITKTSGSHNGITYNWNGDICSVSGTSTDVSVNALFANAPLPNGLAAGKTYHVDYKTTNTDIELNFVWRTSASGTPSYLSVFGPQNITIPSGVTHMAVRLYVARGKTISPAATVSAVKMLNRESINEMISRYVYGGKSQTDNGVSALTYFFISNHYSADNKATPADIPYNSYTYTNGVRLGEGFPEKVRTEGSFWWIFCLGNMVYASAPQRVFIAINAYENKEYRGQSLDSGETVAWISSSAKHANILCIGSSFGQDATVYAPYLMENMGNVDITFGIVYMSGGAISQYNQWFDDDTPLNYYKKNINETAWSNAAQKTLKQVLHDENWDIILINQSAYDGGVESTYADLNEYLYKLTSYVGHSVKFGYLMPQAALGYTDRYTFTDLVGCAQKVLDESAASFLIPSGTAIENARNTTLNSIGDRPGGLAYDTTGHLQEGLPVLISNYVTAQILLSELGETGGIMGCSIRPTAEWVSIHNIPGQNGTSTGVNDNNCIIGQRCAVQAIKHPYEVSI